MNVLVTGGCGFIGTHAAMRFSTLGHRVTLLDDLSRPGAEANLAWLRAGYTCAFVRADVTDEAALARIVGEGGFDLVLHLAAQTAVTTSVREPRHDFRVNLVGTFNVLEAVRRHLPRAIVLNASTNKVYGPLSTLRAEETATRFEIPDRPAGIDERTPVDFHSPYGCSKGAAEQYALDYARIYGLRTVSFRQSCIYGERQFGVEDQGWVAWMAIAHVLGRPITVYGNGKQVRDLLFVDDVIDAYLAAIARIDDVAGTALNLGGGAANALSILELFEHLEKLSMRPVRHGFDARRPGDQAVFISDNGLAARQLGWAPRIGVAEGLGRLYRWVEQNAALFRP